MNTSTIGTIDPTLLSNEISGPSTSFLAPPSRFDVASANFISRATQFEERVKALLKIQDDLDTPHGHAARLRLGENDAILHQAEQQLSLAIQTLKWADSEKVFYGSDCMDETPNEVPLPSVVSALSDESDLDERDSDQFFRGLYHVLRRFHEDKKRAFLVLRGLAVRQRRHVHAIAQFMQFGHMSVGRSSERILLLARDKSALSPELKASVRHLHKKNKTPSPAYSWATSEAAETQAHNNTPIGHLFSANGHYNTPQAQPTVYHYKPSFQGSLDGTDGGYFSGASTDSTFSSVSSRNGRRQNKSEGGFLCFHPGCFESFDRQCDLSHHERSHLPYDQRPYPCDLCDKRFLFPKDLKRHEKTHRGGEMSSNREQ